MNPRKFIELFKTKTGNFVIFALLVIIGGTLFYGYRSSQNKESLSPKTTQIIQKPDSNQPTTVRRSTLSFDPPAKIPFSQNPVEEISKTKAPSTPPLPITLFSSDKEEKELSQTYAPYGRLIPCETIITIDSAKIETPIIGFVTEDLYHEGRLIVPAGAEVHGKAQTDRSRERIASDTSWFIVWRTTDRMNGAELPIKGLALDMERDFQKNGEWALTDGSAGLRGDIIKADNWAEIKLFAATFLSAAAAGLQDTQQTTSALTGASTQSPTDSPKNAALQATSAVINEYARQISDAIKRDGFYVRVPAGKQFYLYVTQTIDQEEAKRGQSQIVQEKRKQP